jgi:hypothetical protein
LPLQENPDLKLSFLLSNLIVPRVPTLGLRVFFPKYIDVFLLRTSSVTFLTFFYNLPTIGHGRTYDNVYGFNSYKDSLSTWEV